MGTVSILAPNAADARALTAMLKRRDHHARWAWHGGKHVVLTTAPVLLVNRLCRGISDEMRRRVG